MIAVLRALLLTATLACALAPAAPAHADEIDRRIREITEPHNTLEEAYLRAVLALTLLLGGVIFISGADDAFLDACYWLRRLGRRRKVLPAHSPELAAMLAKPQAPFAIMVPAWKEAEVIAAMVENTVNTLDYEAYRIFCGVYPNDAATRRQVDRMAERYPGVVARVDVPHDGPTCKADCLNHIVRRVLDEEGSGGERIAGLVLHDSEDVIHPLELRVFNALLPEHDLVQLPVFSLPRKWTEFTAGTYMDDFAESHAKDMLVREALAAIVPGAGVASCYSRRALAALWACGAGEPFNTASLTEDYDLSFRLHSLRMKETFTHLAVQAEEFRAPGVPGCTGQVVSTHEYFPDGIRAAYRQRARWIIGIAFQGWQHLRWRGTMRQRYFLFRDRKGLVTAPATAIAYLLLANYALVAGLGSPGLQEGLQAMLSTPALSVLLVLNAGFMLNRAAQRVYFVGRCYGALQGALALARMPVNNLINFLAVMRAWRLFLGHLVCGRKLAWDKTAHVFPELQRQAPTLALKAFGAVALACALLGGAPRAIAQVPELTGRAYELADQAYKALEKEDLERALRLVIEARRHAPKHPNLLLLQADILSRQEKNAEAAELVRGLDAAQLGGWGLAQRGYIWLKLGERAAAEQDFTKALEAGSLERDSRANIAGELGYLALARNDDAAALEWFRAALASPAPGMATASIAADAGYAAMRRGENRAAIELFKRAIDENKNLEETSVYDMRRAIDSMSRRWGATLSIGHSSLAGLTVPGATGRDLRVVQAGAEVSYTPERFGFRDGKLFQWYANGFQVLSANDPGYGTGADSRVMGFGARYKPLREHYLMLGLERRVSNSPAERDDWLTRVAFSASRQTDWNPVRGSWPTWQFYTENVWFLQSHRLIQPFDARLGHSWKVPGWHGAVATPYIGVAGEYDKAQNPRMAAGIGPGIALRYWYGETEHRAFPRRLDFSMQYRFRLTEARRGGGLFALLSWSF
jgi:adsorption protein B